jgi:hypothetical protein
MTWRGMRIRRPRRCAGNSFRRDERTDTVVRLGRSWGRPGLRLIFCAGRRVWLEKSGRLVPPDGGTPFGGGVLGGEAEGLGDVWPGAAGESGFDEILELLVVQPCPQLLDGGEASWV